MRWFVEQIVFSLLLLAVLANWAAASTWQDEERATVIVAVGAPGEERFESEFVRWADLWAAASEEAGARHLVIGLESAGELSDRERLHDILLAENTTSAAELWLVLIGHGTFDGKEARFNLRGPDLSATDLAEWLKPFERPVAIMNCSSASGPFINKLSGPDRVIITATRSGYEESYARFGGYLAEAIASPEADLDKDGQTSALEAFLVASRRTAEFYEAEGRLATEHALLDDNGDGVGTPADWFRGVRAVRRPADGARVDGLRAHQFHLVRSEEERRMPLETRARRDELELAVAALRESRDNYSEDEYYRRLENLLLELAGLYPQCL
jgi:hypothetical protein